MKIFLSWLDFHFTLVTRFDNWRILMRSLENLENEREEYFHSFNSSSTMNAEKQSTDKTKSFMVYICIDLDIDRIASI